MFWPAYGILRMHCQRAGTAGRSQCCRTSTEQSNFASKDTDNVIVFVPGSWSTRSCLWAASKHAISLGHWIGFLMVRVRPRAGGVALPPGLHLWYAHIYEEVSQGGTTKEEGRGRPPSGGRDPHVTIRMPADLIATLTRGRGTHVGRSEAIRRLVEIGLKAKE